METFLSIASAVILIFFTIILDDYIKNIFVTKQAPRWFWSKVKKVIPRSKQREVYRSFRSDYRQIESMTIKVYMVTMAVVTLKDNDDDFTSCK